jgi:hypothetical protein
LTKLEVCISLRLVSFESKGVSKLKFYNVKTRSTVEVPDDKVTVVTMKNGKKAAKAEVDGMKLFKILSAADAARLGK